MCAACMHELKMALPCTTIAVHRNAVANGTIMNDDTQLRRCIADAAVN